MLKAMAIFLSLLPAAFGTPTLDLKTSYLFTNQNRVYYTKWDGVWLDRAGELIQISKETPYCIESSDQGEFFGSRISPGYSASADWVLGKFADSGSVTFFTTASGSVFAVNHDGLTVNLGTLPGYDMNSELAPYPRVFKEGAHEYRFLAFKDFREKNQGFLIRDGELEKIFSFQTTGGDLDKTGFILSRLSGLPGATVWMPAAGERRKLEFALQDFELGSETIARFAGPVIHPPKAPVESSEMTFLKQELLRLKSQVTSGIPVDSHLDEERVAELRAIEGGILNAEFVEYKPLLGVDEMDEWLDHIAWIKGRIQTHDVFLLIPKGSGVYHLYYFKQGSQGLLTSEVLCGNNFHDQS
jgi:hypothetical protein